MRKKIWVFTMLVCVLCLSALALAACGGETRVHEHKLFDFEAHEATCIAEGNKAYQECLYCRKKLIDGKEVTDKDIILPVDASNHAALEDVEAQAPKCVETGVRAHKKCGDCHKLYVDGAEVQEEAVIVAAKGQHTFSAGSLKCSECDAYKLLFDGDYYIIDATNYRPFVANPLGTYYTSSNKATYLSANLSNRMTIGTQMQSGSTRVVDGKEYVLTNTGSLSCFTRIAYGSGSEAYIGRLLVTFDAVVSSGAEVQRVGVKVVDNTATVYNGPQQAKLLGNNASEENNPSRAFDVGKKYRFAYEVEVTDAEQLVQIFTCFGGAETVTLSNMHFVEIDGETGRLGSVLVNFDEADAAPTVKEECTHGWQYAVTAVSPTCMAQGVKAHDFCPQCGHRTESGTELEKADHDYVSHEATESTCVTQGNDAYSQCSLCHKYFDESNAEIEGVPLRELAEHTGEWQSNADKHWRHCPVCDSDVDEAAHIPGAEATANTPQTCTVCGYIIVSALSHTHTPSALVEAKDATCTEDGNVAYYRCTDPECGKYFSDQACMHEIAEVFSPSTGHSMEAKVDAKAATCTEDGNLEYYHCPRCDKYFADTDGNTDITDTYLTEKTGHSMTRYEVAEATCSNWGIKTAHSHCANCGKYFTANDGLTELTEEEASDLYITTMPAHSITDNECSVCGAEYAVSTIVAAGANSFANQGATVNPELVANPGKWACQGSGTATSTNSAVGSIAEGVLKIKSNGGRNAFPRVLPAKEDGTAFVGTYSLSFDFKVVSTKNNSATANVTVGFFIQSATVGGNLGTIADVAMDFTVGTTYRFTVFVETTDENQFVQFNVRNPSGGDIKDFEISNASFVYYPETSNFGMVRLTSITFAEAVTAPTEPASASYAAFPALVPNKYEYI